MFCFVRSFINYLRFRRVAKQIDKRVLRDMIRTQKFLDSHNVVNWEELKRALQK